MPNPIPQNQDIYVEFKRQPPKYEMERMDAYTDFYGLGFVTYGEKKIITPTSISIIAPNNVAFTDKHKYHRSVDIKNDYHERYLIKFTDEAVSELLKQLKAKNISELLTRNIYKFNEGTQIKLANLFQEALNVYFLDTKYSEIILEKILHQIILTVLGEHLPNDNHELIIDNNNDKIFDALNYLNLHFQESPTIEEVAELVNFSPSHFSRLFKKSTNMSYSSYLSSLKLQHATLLLQHSNKSIEEIAQLCGYSNGSYLSARFKEVNNISPHNFRQKSSTDK